MTKKALNKRISVYIVNVCRYISCNNDENCISNTCVAVWFLFLL